MIVIKCLKKHRNKNGAIIGYTLQSQSGEIIQATPQQVKAELQGTKYNFTNLQLDKAGRIIDKKSKPSTNTEVKIKQQTKEKQPAQDKFKEQNKIIAEIKERIRRECNAAIEYVQELEKIAFDPVYDFIASYNGTNSYGVEATPKRDMLEEIRKYFTNIIESIRKEVKEHPIVAYRYDYDDFSAKLSVPAEEFIAKSGCEWLRESFFRIINYKYESILEFGEETLSDGFVGILLRVSTISEYEDIKPYIMNIIEEKAANEGLDTIEWLTMHEYDFVEANSRLGELLVCDFVKDVLGRTLDYYIELVIFDVNLHLLQCFGNHYKSNINDRIIEECLDYTEELLYKEEYGRRALAMSSKKVLPKNPDPNMVYKEPWYNSIKEAYTFEAVNNLKKTVRKALLNK